MSNSQKLEAAWKRYLAIPQHRKTDCMAYLVGRMQFSVKTSKAAWVRYVVDMIDDAVTDAEQNRAEVTTGGQV